MQAFSLASKSNVAKALQAICKTVALRGQKPLPVDESKLYVGSSFVYG